MATWEDGPEYAPIQRPEGFTVPPVEPLSAAPEVDHPAAGAPVTRPRFTDPPAPVAPLAALVPEIKDPRDPTTPFQVVTSAVTANDSAWGAAHWSRPDDDWGPPAPGAEGPYDPMAPMVHHHPPPPPSGYPAPGGAPASGGHAPGDQPAPYGAPTPSGFPAPGTTEWFAPPPGSPAAQAFAGQVDAQEVIKAVTPGVLITLGIGAIIWPVAPLTLAIAFGLAAARIRVAAATVRKVFLAGLGVLAFFAIVGALTNGDSFGDWWGFVGWWALAISWVVIIALLVVTYRALKTPGGRSGSGGYQQPWA